MKRSVLFCSLLLCFSAQPWAQQTTILDSSQAGYRTVIAGKEYEASGMKAFWLGQDWRRVWTTPVRVRMLDLDTMKGGLTPMELGGGRQTKTLHVKDAQGKRWVLRSVNKTYTLALPEIARGTVVETIMNDQIATNHPYAALAVPKMAEAAGVYHANPQLFIIPYNPRLDSFNNIFANMLVMMEERPDKTHEGEATFGRPKDIDGSDKMVEKVTEDNDNIMDQHQYVKTRLFDMFLGDWGRHIDNWRWAEFDSGKLNVYRPVPKDRDQAWAKFQGLLLTIGKTVGGLNELQTFGPTIKDIAWFNHTAMDLDRRFTNSLTRQVWVDSARALQRYLTDAVIENGVRQMPPEIVAVSGAEVIRNLKQRRDDLAAYADAYYGYLAQKVDIPGSEKHEYFEVLRKNDNETQINIFKITKEGKIKEDTLFSRTFLTNETKEVRLYGLDGNDRYHVEGQTNDGITVRIIGGEGNDSLYDASTVNGRTHKTKFYDTNGTPLSVTPETKIRLSDSTFHYPFEDNFEFDHSGLSVAPGLDPYYRIYVGAAWKKRTYGWREKPFKSEIKLGLNYSLSENTWHPYFTGEHPMLFGAWNLNYQLGYDGSRRFHYFGTGNETSFDVNDDRYYYLRTENFYAGAGLNKGIHKWHNIGFNLNYDRVRVITDFNTYLTKPSTNVDPESFEWKQFGTGELTYQYTRLNDAVVPTKGLHFGTAAAYVFNLDEKKSFTRLTGNMGVYVPLFSTFSLFVNTGAATLNGEPEFYQQNNIGGNKTLRGYLRNRFYGNTVFYDQNELRWIPNVKSYLFNGKIGLIALYDIGRVWQPGETSGTWHTGYGAGLMIAPFNKIAATVYYSVSPEDNVVNLRVGKFF